VVTVAPGRCESAVFWRPARRRLRLARPEDYEAALREALDQAVASSLRGAGDVASHLSGGLDSTSVAASASLLQAERGGRVIAYTAAPRRGFDGLEMPGRFANESAHAAAVAALYPNLEHHVVRPGWRGPLDEWDRNAQLFDKPTVNPINAAWSYDILDAVKARGLGVLLGGDVGNATLSYEGREIFAELLQGGRWLHWWREALACVGRGGGSWSHVMMHTLKPMLPNRVLRRIPGTQAHGLTAFGRQTGVPAAQAKRFEALRGETLINAKDGWATRMEMLLRVDHGNEHKGILAGWGVENRDPTADRRLVEFCLSVPTDQFFRDGVGRSLVRRAMAGRLPPVVTEERRAGLQSADWYERLGAQRGRLLEELGRLEACAPLAERTDVAKLRTAIEDWPTQGWEQRETVQFYAVALMRTLCAAHFARRVLGSNA
jgi:asparagine synthase (glutamine-hydrolysing)